jgi:outer membrane protein assembly factor BamB
MNPTLITLTIIACLFGGCQSYYRVMSPEVVTDYSVSLKAKAKKLSRTSPHEAWRIPVKTAAVDEILALPEHRVLVGLTEAGGFIGKGATFPAYGPYVLYDTHTGREIWRVGRDSDYETHSYAARPTQASVLIEHSGPKETTLTAVSLASGKPVWSKTVPAGVPTSLSPELNLLIIAEGGSSGTLTAVDLAQGTTRWAADYQGSGSDGQPVLHVAGEQVLVLQRAFTSRTLQNGRVLFSIPDVGQPASATPPIVTTDGILLASVDGKISLIKSSGGLVWQAMVPGTPRTIGTSETACFIEIQPEQASSPRLVALSLAKGRKLWEQDLPGPLYSSLQAAGKLLLFSLTGSLEMWDGETGNSVRSIVFPSEPAVRLSDRLIIFPEHAVLAMEKSITGIRLTDGHALWSFSSLYPAFQYQIAVSDLGGSRNIPTRAINAKTANIMPQPLWQQTVSDGVKWAEQNRAYVYQSTAGTLGSGSSSRADRLDASSARAMANQNVATMRSMDQSFQRSMASAQMLQASANFMVSAPDMGRAIGEAMVEKASAISARASLPQAIKDHQRTVQGSFLIKPIVAEGVTGLLVVDIRNGSWMEIPTSPAVFNTYRKFTQVSVAPDGAQLISNGTGLDSTKWEIDDSSSGTETFVYPGILGYDLAAMTLKSPDAYTTQSLKVLLKPKIQ